MARKGSRRHISRSRRMTGGGASENGVAIFGNTNAQFERVLSQSGPYGSIHSNNIIGTGGQGVIPASYEPTSQQLALVQKAGRRRKRGGFLGEVAGQALVPLSLLTMQQTYRRKRGGKRGTRKHRRR